MKLDTKTSDKDTLARVKVVTVNGKGVHHPVAVDTDEGWVDVLMPKIIDEVEYKIDSKITIEDEQVDNTTFHWVTKRLFGKVEILWNKEKK